MADKTQRQLENVGGRCRSKRAAPFAAMIQECSFFLGTRERDAKLGRILLSQDPAAGKARGNSALDACIGHWLGLNPIESDRFPAFWQQLYCANAISAYLFEQVECFGGAGCEFRADA